MDTKLRIRKAAVYTLLAATLGLGALSGIAGMVAGGGGVSIAYASCDNVPPPPDLDCFSPTATPTPRPN